MALRQGQRRQALEQLRIDRIASRAFDEVRRARRAARLLHEHAERVVRIVAEPAGSHITRARVEGQRRGLVDAGLQREAGAAARRRPGFEKGQQRARHAAAAVRRPHEHALEFAKGRPQHHRPAADRVAPFVARHGEQHVRLQQCGQVEPVVALRRIERLLERVERIDEREDVGLVGAFEGNGHGEAEGAGRS